MDDKKSPEQIERDKTKKERGADWGYTTNHAIICTLTDFIDPYLNTTILRKLGNESKLSQSWGAEIIGDFGAVPITVGMQRFFPGFMSSVSHFVEPAFGRAFKASSRHDAREWAVKHNFSVDSKECKERADRIYNYEITHLPQALVWTVSAAGLNVASQRALGSKAPLGHLAAGKVGGSILTAGITLGARMLFPRKAEKVDKFFSEKLMLSDSDDLDDLTPDDKKKDWSKRVKLRNDRSNESQPGLN